MILADASVWVDHLRRGDHALAGLLTDGQIVCHRFVIGELACGNLGNRREILRLLAALPPAPEAEHDEALHLLDSHQLQGQGLGWVDVHLLASSRLGGCALWTRDKALATAARALGVDA